MIDSLNKALYANQSHQLLITLSKQFSVEPDGTFRHHPERLKVTLKNFEKFEFKPVFHFVLRDKYSGVFYSELVTPDEFPPIEEFLHRAWTWKDNYFFAGIPEDLSVPSYAVSPALSRLLSNLSIEEFQPPFFNEAGVRVIRIIESELIKFSQSHFYDEIEVKIPEVIREINHVNIPNKNLKNDRYDIQWAKSIERVIFPPSLSIMREAMKRRISFARIDSTPKELEISESERKTIKTAFLQIEDN